MKLVLTAILLFTVFLLAAQNIPNWDAQRSDLARQSALYKDSPSHLIQRGRDTRDYNVGDTHTFWRWNLSVMPPLWIQTPATCRAVGEHCYIFVADSEWNVHMDQADVDTALARLEDSTISDPGQGAIEMDISLFGPIPDELDNDPRLIVFYSALGSFQGNYFDGYFSPYNQVTEAEAQQMNPSGHSNECEMIYMTCYPLDPVAPLRLAVLAHELEHLIHWGQDANEESWIDEGCAELAMVAYGLPDPISGFNSNPDNSLTAWNQTTADYVKVMLFFTYLEEHYDANNLIRDLVEDPANGLNSLSQQIPLHFPELDFADIFVNWNLANVLDSPEAGMGLYDYQQLDLPAFAMTSLNQYPAQTNQTIQPCAADYLKYNLGTQNVHFTLQSNIPITVSCLDFDLNNVCIGIQDQGTGTFFDLDPQAGNAHHVVYALSNPATGTASYSYTTTVGDYDPAIPPPAAREIICYPNPFRAGGDPLRIEVKNATSQTIARTIEIFDLRGRLVRSLKPDLPGQPCEWDGRDNQGRFVASGIYFVRLGSGAPGSSVRRICVLD